MKKLKSKKGESFVEILVSILIVALGCMMIATMYSAAMNMNVKASQEDDEYYKAMEEMERMFETGNGTASKKVTISEEGEGGKSKDISVYVYGNDKTSAYKRH